MNGMIKVSDVLRLTSIDFDGLVMEFIGTIRAKDTYPETLGSVCRHGVQSPILIRYETLCNGHHRVVACLELGIEEIPFTDDPEIGWANEFEWPEETEACHE